MIYELIRRDPAWKFIVALSVLAIFSMPVANLGRPYTFTGMLVMLFLFCAIQVQAHRRLTMFEAALPLSGRDIYLARALALLAMVWVPFALGMLSAFVIASPDWPLGLLKCAALLTVMMLMPLSLRLPEFSAPKWTVGVVWTAGTFAGTLGFYYLPSAFFVGLCLTLAAAIFLWTWNALPPAFQIASLEVEELPTRRVGAGRATPAWWVLTKSTLPWFTLIYVPVVLGQAVLGSWVYACCFTVVLYSQIRERTRWANALPVSPRKLLLATLAPTLLPMVIGAALSVGPSQSVRMRAVPQGTANVDVPLEFWREWQGGQPPVVVAPWGETHTPPVAVYFGYTFYNPYSVGPQNSTRFMEWQYYRAKEALSAPAFNGWRFRIFFALAILAAGLAIAWLLEFQYSYRLGLLSQRTKTAIQIAFFVPLFCVPLGFDMFHLGGASASASTAATRAILIWAATRLQGNIGAMILAGIIPVILLYGLLEWQFRQSEQEAFRRNRV